MAAPAVGTVLRRAEPEGDGWDEVRVIGHVQTDPDLPDHDPELAISPRVGFAAAVTGDADEIQRAWPVTVEIGPDAKAWEAAPWL